MSFPGLEIHHASFRLGMMNCFAEMVAAGVKRLAISPPLRPGEYEEIRQASEEIARGAGINQYLETSLLVSHLQSPGFTAGKWSVLYYKDGDVLETYLGLKERKRILEESGALTPEAHREISTEFMRLLSYPEDVIQARLDAGGEDDPFLLLEDDPES